MFRAAIFVAIVFYLLSDRANAGATAVYQFEDPGSGYAVVTDLQENCPRGWKRYYAYGSSGRESAGCYRGTQYRDGYGRSGYWSHRGWRNTDYGEMTQFNYRWEERMRK